ncbi:MAG: MBL fold metallo-hydrolase [Clostridia bacterium]|nr:MBL fold metallo-hydrolase [Clostridia bacterium]
MEIKWYGHSCFLLTNNEGVRLLMDPCDRGVGYDLHDIEADIMTISHSHHDHNYYEAVRGNPIRIIAPGETIQKGVRIIGVPTWHDENEGRQRGNNIMFIVEMDDIRVLHCGDLGHVLPDETVKAIGDIDVLLVPVGGKYTVDYKGARAVANQLRPSVVIPMHYKTNACAIDLDTVDNFLTSAEKCLIHRLGQSSATLGRINLGEDRVLVLDYERC